MNKNSGYFTQYFGALSDIYVDCDANKIYYAINSINYIYSANLDGSNRQIMVSAVSHPSGIGIDKINGKIYWTEGSNGLIRRSNMDGSNAETILSSLNNPLDIAVDTVNGKIYYSDGWTDGLYRAGLDGSSAGFSNGLGLVAGSDGSTIHGCVIDSFNQSGIYATNSSGHTFAGNYIGTNVTGLADWSNGARGIDLINADNCTIGGTTATDRNVIGGSANAGIMLFTGSDGNTIQGNYIGIGSDMATAIANGDAGICIPDSNNNLIGGTTAGAGNVIANNAVDGIHTSDTSTDNAILSNSIFTNSALGIDNNEDGVTANDAGDSDSGPNDLLNFPVIKSATVSAGTITVNCELDAPAASYRIEFFTNLF